MEISKTTEFAHALYSAHGDKAEAEAARKAREFEDSGNAVEADKWRAIRRAISQIRGPHES